ncbi:hypothetical protein G4B88_016521 [Cannabis sativa]|uniref:Uncharacterized protein n=1 Tax=Cannabis sativa TaxID=3483 RepID=A0A7J6H8G0_CANSA|nr:hypothetical protein G4B88_016521 [Cannabis sativa]
MYTRDESERSLVSSSSIFAKANDIPGHILLPAPNGMSSKLFPLKVKLLSFTPILWIPSYCPCMDKYVIAIHDTTFFRFSWD